MDIIKYKQLLTVSNPEKVRSNLNKYLGKLTVLYLSDRKNKKYFIIDPKNNLKIHFGDINFEDYTKHLDEDRKSNYLKRSSKMIGNWKNNKFSPNNLSMNLLWK